MTKKLSALELTIMERRFRKSEQDSAIRNYRRKKGESAVSQGSRWAQKMVSEVRAGEAAAAANRANAVPDTRDKLTNISSNFVVMKLKLDDPDIPFKSASLVMSIGISIGDRVVLDHTDSEMAKLPSVVVPTAKIGTAKFRVYPSLASAMAAAVEDNAAIDAYKQAKLKGQTV
ncbi:hypothetical protein ACQZ6H_10650 [Agrobacterium fabrum]|uniref:hypothetical protein n=1 Tax=Agrobacterium fabrum TaxID=1176649 RepID=UPI001571CE05|nr:hypothetical protein [Agrobacterium fabrum]WIE26429.1 hypothetical protein G6L42_008380 [Agrobacterium fabrum]WIE42386.1 hypothetical protein G6L76_008380 [Agrobacterium fabrum]